MVPRSFLSALPLVASVIGSVLLAACAEEGDPKALTNGTSSAYATRGTKGEAETAQSAAPTAKQTFLSKVAPALASSCGSCHGAGGTGPTWVAAGDAEKTYELQFLRGYVTLGSPMVSKGQHAGPSLVGQALTDYVTWIELETKERGGKAPTAILDAIAGCLDPAKFKAIGLETLVTTARTADNNPQKQQENTDECTGCNATPCAACHSADPGTGFFLSLGNTLLPETETFEQTKSTRPPFLQKYIGLDASGRPVPSHALKAKSDATVKVAKAYEHPMYTLTPAMLTGIDAFVSDAIAKYAQGTCGR